jgi:lipopolysaccharide export system permease protein
VKRVDRLVLDEVAGPFFGSLLLFTSLFFAGGELTRFTEYLQKGETWWTLGQLVLCSLPFIVSLTVPMAMLLATLLGVGRLSSDSELVALTAAGIPFARVLLPVVCFAVVVAGPLLIANAQWIPLATARREAIISRVKERGGAALSTRNAFHLSVGMGGDQTLEVLARGGVDFGSVLSGDAGRATLYNVTLTFFTGTRATSFVAADQARWVVGTQDWRLEGALWSAVERTAQVTRADAVDTQQVTLGTPDELSALTRPENEKTTPQLWERARLRRATGQESEALKADVEVARRIALPIATVVFAIIGAPLGVRRPREGRGIGFGLSVLITFTYWMLTQVATALGGSGALPVHLAVNLPNLIGLAVGLILLKRVQR